MAAVSERHSMAVHRSTAPCGCAESRSKTTPSRPATSTHSRAAHLLDLRHAGAIVQLTKDERMSPAASC
jgi:hypothetical protein